MIKEEIFRNIEGYEEIYQISNLGRVKSLGNDKSRKEKILKTAKDKFGYQYVILYKNGKMKHMKVHRLVAQAFIENPLNLPEVNHIDENKENNIVGNLEWCDRKYNINYGTRTERMSKTQTNRKDLSVQIDQFTKNGILVKTWCSSMEAERNGYNQPNIIRCCKGNRKSHAGYIWKYHK